MAQTLHHGEGFCGGQVSLNNVEASNHGAASRALFRAFLSRAAFESRAQYVAEFLVEFTPDVSEPIWPQAYAALLEREEINEPADA